MRLIGLFGYGERFNMHKLYISLAMMWMCVCVCLCQSTFEKDSIEIAVRFALPWAAQIVGSFMDEQHHWQYIILFYFHTLTICMYKNIE